VGKYLSMSDQQAGDDRDQKDPYPADQQFGKAAAEDQERVDAGEEPVGTDSEPNAGNKADS
jgi:hypothetical protein